MTAGLALCRLLLASATLIVPAPRRRRWREQWDAELVHYSRWLARERRASLTCTWRLFARATGAIPHAAMLRLQSWSPRMIEQDLKSAWRLFVRKPVFTAVSALILALGIGANATMFSWVESILLNPLDGVPDQQRLVALTGTYGSRDNLSFSYPNFVDIRSARPDGLEDVMAFRVVAVTVATRAEPSRAFGELVSGNFFDVLHVRPLLGRTFRDNEATTPGSAAVAVISDGLWGRLFARDPSVVGRMLKINTTDFTIIGVLPPAFRGSAAGLALDVYVPMSMQRTVMPGDRLAARGNSWLEVYGRLAPGSRIEQVRAGLRVVAERLEKTYPQPNEGRGIAVVPLSQADASGMLRPIMATLMTFVGLLLIVACTNVAALLLARAAGRQRELAVRLAVGASRAQLVRQLVVEAFLLALAGGAAGLLMANWTSRALAWFIPPTPYPIAFEVGVDQRVIAFGVAATFVTVVIAGLLPALRASRPDVSRALKDAAAANIGGSRGRLRQALVIAQIALSMLLLVCAALFVRSLRRAETADTGYTARTGLFASLDLQAAGYDAARGSAFIQTAIERVSAVPGVRSVSVASSVPLDISGGSDQGFSVEGYEARQNEELIAYYNRVGPGYFDTMGISLVEGRGFTNRDTSDGPAVVVINQTMASRYFAGRSAVGGRIRFGNGPVTVVGVARDGKYQSLTEKPKNYMYIPVLQSYWPALVLHVRTSLEPAGVLPGIAREIRRLDSGLPLFDVRTIEEHRRIAMFVPKLASTLLGVFGGLALLLAVVGLYGIVAFTVAQQTREIGVRIALGATRLEVLGLVLRQGLAVAAVGVAIGFVLAGIASPVLQKQLIGISALDPMSFAGSAVLLLGVACAACAVPAFRAAFLQPLSALRHD
ncbi:MAG TPA: ABC transporter permease [Vicinamibacterales bacterium]|nr:ABC transporter permease [Vicinamibacterales bacterium]